MSSPPYWPVLQLLLSAMPGVSRTADSGRGPGLNAHRWRANIYPRRVAAGSQWSAAFRKGGLERRTVGPVDWVLSANELHEQAHSKGQLHEAISSCIKLINPRGGFLLLQLPTVPAPALTKHEAHTLHGTWEWWQLQVENIASTLGRETTWCWPAMWRLQIMRERLVATEEIQALANWTLDNVLLVKVVKRPTLSERRSWWWRFRQRVVNLFRPIPST